MGQGQVGALGAKGRSPAPMAAGLCVPQAGACVWWAAQARAAAAWR